MNPKVSMVMPCYNSEPYLDNMLRSIIEQHYDNIELIAVNGNSTDGTKEKLHQWIPIFTERGYDLRYFDKPDSNMLEAVNEGLGHVTGSYVCFPDSDDWMHPDFVSEFIRCLDENPDCGWAICDVVYMNEEGKILYYCKNSYNRNYVNDNLSRFVSMLDNSESWHIFAKIDFFQKCFPSGKLQDGLSCGLQLSIGLSGRGNYAYTPNVLYHNIRHSGSGYERITETYDKVVSSHDMTLKTLEKCLDDLPVSDHKCQICRKAFVLFIQKEKYRFSLQYHDQQTQSDLEEELLEDIRDLFPKNSLLKNDLQNKFFILCDILVLYLLGIYAEIRSLNGASFVLYGAGRWSRLNLPIFLELGLKPMAIWDKAAQEGDTLLGVPIVQPMTTLDFDTPILMGIIDFVFSQEAIAMLQEAGYKNIWSNEQVMDLLQKELCNRYNIS